MRANPSWLTSRPTLMRRGLTALLMIGITVAAFYWGRLGVGSKLEAQSIANRVGAVGQAVAPPTDYSQRVVAYIYGNIPITRQELGEYLIARFGQERIDFLINRRLVEMACQGKNIQVTDAEVEAQFREELKGFGQNMTAKDFTNQVLKRFNKSLYEWKEDVIRPKLMLARLCKPMVEVTPQDLRNAYEAKYGPKVQCRMIAFPNNNRQTVEIWTKISKSEQAFAEEAKHQYIPTLAAKGGEIAPIHKHFGDARVEAAAFALIPGQVTQLMEMPDKNFIVLKCDKLIPADTTKSFDSVRLDLDKEMRDIKLAQKIPEYFAQLRKQAQPHVLIANQVPEDDLIRNVQRDLNERPGSLTPHRTTPSGN